MRVQDFKSNPPHGCVQGALDRCSAGRTQRSCVVDTLLTSVQLVEPQTGKHNVCHPRPEVALLLGPPALNMHMSSSDGTNVIVKTKTYLHQHLLKTSKTTKVRQTGDGVSDVSAAPAETWGGGVTPGDAPPACHRGDRPVQDLQPCSTSVRK
ncbi:unnamed protein product [Gadus morhua 'NCC']